MAHYIAAQEDIHTAGYSMAIIGNGRLEHLQDFKNQFPTVDKVYTDPRRSIHRALELRHGVATLLSTKLVTHAIRAAGSGHNQGKTAGDPWQQGGVAVVDTAGNVVFLHKDETAGDHLQPEKLLRELATLNNEKAYTTSGSTS